MTFRDWILSNYPEGSGIKGTWGTLHIVTLVLVIGVIVGLSFLRRKDEKVRRGVIVGIAALILLFEVTRRVTWLVKDDSYDFTSVMRTLLPRPWCAISCWFFMVSAVLHKKFLYNFTAMSGFLCTLIFFAYPTVGFNNKYILFENLYSISTHALLMIGCISLITFRFTDFSVKTAWKEGICLAATFAYAFVEIFLLKIEADPLYFMPVSEAREVLGIASYPLYLALYILFLCVYFGAFYGVQYLAAKKKKSK